MSENKFLRYFAVSGLSSVHEEVVLFFVLISVLISGMFITSVAIAGFTPDRASTNTSKQYADVVNRGWTAPPPSVQLDREALDDRMGLGRLFLPVMSESRSEPFYAVFSGDEKVGEMPMGSSIFLKPGKYTVRYGSGTREQMMSAEVEIHPEQTFILEPDWSALTVRLMDETRQDLNLNYEIFRMPEGESFGVGTGALEELGEKPRTWILPPGIYKIVKLGESYNTFTDFASVRLIPGNYTRYTIVIDSGSGHFIGSGILGRELSARNIHSWKVYGSLSGSFVLSRDEVAGSEDPTDDMIFSTQLDTRVKYDTRPHYFLSDAIVELAWNKQQGLGFETYMDRLDFKNTYIYYFLRRLGVYGSMWINTKLLPDHYTDIPDTSVVVTREKGLETGRWKNRDDFTLSPSFAPLILKEGLGISLAILESSRYNVNLRTGLGLQQTLNHNVYIFSDDSSSDSLKVFDKQESSYVYGTQAVLVGYFRLMNRMVITTDLDLIFPFREQDPVVKYWENVINFRLSKNLFLDYRVRMSNEETDYERVLTDQTIMIRLSWLVY